MLYKACSCMPKCWLWGFPEYFSDTLGHTGVPALDSGLVLPAVLFVSSVSFSLFSRAATALQAQHPFVVKHS